MNINDIKIYDNSIRKDLDYIIETINSNNMDKNFEFIDIGGEGTVYKYKKYAIKFFMEFKKNNLDSDILFELQNLTSYPIVYAGNEKFMIYEFIEGKTLKNCTIKDLNQCEDNCLKVLLKDLKETLNKKIIFDDLSDSNIILNNKGILKIIDVGLFSNFDTSSLLKELDFNDIRHLINKNMFYSYCGNIIYNIYDIIENRYKKGVF